MNTYSISFVFIFAVLLIVLITPIDAARPHVHRKPASPSNLDQSTVSGYVTSVNGKLSYQVGSPINAVAWATFSDTLNATGWGILQVYTNGSITDPVLQMTAAGYVEGAITSQRISEHSRSMNEFFFGAGQPVPNDVVKFIADQKSWMKSQISSAGNDSRWLGVQVVYAQLEGLIAGYTENNPPSQLTELDFNILQLTGDLLDLLSALGVTAVPDWKTAPIEEIDEYIRKHSMCSALIKVNGDLSEMYMAHAAWFTYSAMNRIFKHYYFNLGDFAAAKTMSFSSYPGFLESLDDFYMMKESGLVMLETTNNIFNTSLYKLVVPQSLFAWQRVRLANLMATGGREWYELVSFHNSGTYNNQYMIIDQKLFTPGQPLLPDTLWVVEQIPGLVVGGDVTRELERGYFPSYNVPYFIEIYNKSGYPMLSERLGTNIDYQLAPRAKIFRRDQGKVVDLTTFESQMRYNDYKNDPYSSGSPWNAICSRGDLAGSDDGCYDSKVTSASLFKQGVSYALNGPTTSDGRLPPFEWTGSWAKDPHYGQPRNNSNQHD